MSQLHVSSFPTDLPRVRSITFFAYPPSLLELVTKRILGFDKHGYLTPMLLPYEGSLSFGRQIWLELSSDSSLGLSTPYFHCCGASICFLRTPLFSPTYSLLLGLLSDFHRLVISHTGRTTLYQKIQGAVKFFNRGALAQSKCQSICVR